MSSAWVDGFCGTLGGCTGIAVGQPFDTVKVRLQTEASLYRGPWDCFRKTVSREGVLALWKGLLAPLAGNAPMNGLMFMGYGAGMRLFDAEFGALPDGAAVDYTRVGVSALFGGFLQCFVATPVELIKCKLQIQHGANAQYTGVVDCVSQRIRQLGWRRGLYQGFVITSLRDVPAFGVYFMLYEWVKDLLTPPDASKPPAHAMLIAGGFAGMATWACTFPLDVIKSTVQTLPDNTPAAKTRAMGVAQRLYKAGGPGVFLRGLVPTVLRAFPVNAVTFAVYETSLRECKAYGY